jgi:hypothetical protein
VNATSDMEASADVQTSESQLERRTRELLLASSESLAGATRSRLTRARFAAVAASEKRMRRQLQRWAPAGVAAAAAIALLVVFVPHGARGPLSPVSNVALEDIDLLSSDLPLNADQDMDYDFYEWAVAQADHPAAATPSDARAPAAGV